jgi:hypothetical protein
LDTSSGIGGLLEAWDLIPSDAAKRKKQVSIGTPRRPQNCREERLKAAMRWRLRLCVEPSPKVCGAADYLPHRARTMIIVNQPLDVDAAQNKLGTIDWCQAR